MAVAAKTPKAAALQTRLTKARKRRAWLADPLAGPREQMALRKELAAEAWGGVTDLARLVGTPITRRSAERKEVGKPATKRAAKRHKRFKEQRGQEPADSQRPAPAPAASPPASGGVTTARRNDVSTGGSVDVSSDVVQRFVRAASDVGDVEIQHADEFDDIVAAMVKAMTLVGDALDTFGDQCDQLKIHPNVTRHLHAAAEAVSDQGERYKSARETFRTVYEPYLEPPERTPSLRFFENSETAA